jgi:hypothetical protein
VPTYAEPLAEADIEPVAPLATHFSTAENVLAVIVPSTVRRFGVPDVQTSWNAPLESTCTP